MLRRVIVAQVNRFHVRRDKVLLGGKRFFQEPLDNIEVQIE